jgi:hypothetical protein
MKRRLWIALAFAGAALAYVLVFRPSDEERVRRQVAALADAVGIDPAERDPRARPLRIQRAFQRILTPWVRVDIADIVEDVHGRDELAGMAISAAETYGDLRVSFGSVHVQIDGTAKLAHVRAVATLAGTDHDGHREREDRDVTIGLENVDGEWRIAALSATVSR